MLTHQQINDFTIPIPDDFKGLDSYREVRVFWKNLPHWRQDGATYFVTFRQRDSIPREMWEKMKEEALWWKKRMTQSSSKITESLEAKFRAFRREYAEKLERTLDEGRGTCELRKPEQREIVERALFRFDGDRYDLESYAVMPNHVHVMLRPKSGFELEKILRSWKTFSGRVINQSRGLVGSFWQANYHDRIIRDEDHFRNAARYILKNPLKGNVRDDASAVYLKDVYENRKIALRFEARKKTETEMTG